MSRTKLLSSAIIILSCLLIIVGCSKTIKNPLNWQVKDFAYTNQDEQTISLSDLKGKVWIADFIFTHCTTVCLPMTANKVTLQKQFKELNLDAHFVSFSVDPERDTPARFKEYGETFGVDFANWDFLTGYTIDEIGAFARESFKSAIALDPNSDQVIHGIQFYLVNQDGVVVKRYDGTNKDSLIQIVNDAKILLNK